MIRTIAIASLTFLATSCQVNMHTSNTNIPESAEPAVVNPNYFPDFKYTAVTIKNMEQAGDFMVIDVSYSGGCAEHEFELVSDGRFESTYPPKLEVKLWHNSHEDRCRSVVDQRLYFDLTPFQYGGTSQVQLKILNDDKFFDYSY